jgi:MoxR-like ATPase
VCSAQASSIPCRSAAIGPWSGYGSYVPYPSADILAAAAADLSGSHPLTIVTIPALLDASRSSMDPIDHPPYISAFGTKQERPVLEAFRLRDTGDRPYLAMWQDRPTFIRSDYPGSTLQRLRTQDLLGQQLFDILWNDDHTKRVATALRANAGAALAENHIKPVNRLSLALWLGRHQDLPELESFLDWFDEQYPLDRTDLDAFYTRSAPDYVEEYEGSADLHWPADEPASNEELIARLHLADTEPEPLDVPSTTPPRSILARTETEDATVTVDGDLRWTRDFCAEPLRDADIARITRRALAQLEHQNIVLPDAEHLVTRCVSALLVGHLILQGPPGTGKTTLARVLAHAFDVHLLESTATSEWSPFHVVGGLQPSSDNSLQPSYGKVTDAALKCALNVRADVNAEAEGDDDAPAEQARRRQGTWLLIDEFNRADIDKAIGSLYTMLSSCDAANLDRSPIDLWFETEGRQQLWVPSRFRIIGAMNDLDTSFVNPISQGLTRRVQFITVGGFAAVEGATGVSPEIRNSLGQAYKWLSHTYGGTISIDPLNAIFTRLEPEIMAAQEVVEGLRATAENVVGWPVGTAQIVDVFKVLLLQVASGIEARIALDWAVADRLVPQMGMLEEDQLLRAADLFDRERLTQSRLAVQHLLSPHGL